MSKQQMFELYTAQIITRTEAEMSEEAYHQAITNIATQDFHDGVYATARYEALKRSYLSVIAPDRKGAIAHIMELPMMKNRTLQTMKLQDSFGHDMLKYDVKTGWEPILTPPEMERAIEFHALYETTWYALQQHVC
ncbi:hypothetical protein [Kurthia massiliensis]|uniref:hypothetical protein n=1 Tax=Kurthia massiliensis TaxID=1033739 RepID=UPI000289922C|nr:hypothetical protein [Kurthia massiliensis]